jgi:hypothetical protein
VGVPLLLGKYTDKKQTDTVYLHFWAVTSTVEARKGTEINFQIMKEFNHGVTRSFTEKRRFSYQNSVPSVVFILGGNASVTVTVFGSSQPPAVTDAVFLH